MNTLITKAGLGWLAIPIGLAVGATVHCGASVRHSMQIPSDGAQWHEDYADAKVHATSEGRDLLLEFTGTDWCHWCTRLNEEVFKTDAFREYASDNLVLVRLDYPRQLPQSQEIKTQNEALQKAFEVSTFPTIILADAQGRPYATTGYQRGGSKPYIEHLTELKQIRIVRDEHFAAADGAHGLERAGHLHEAMKAVGPRLALKHYEATVEEIMALDAVNAAGLRAHYEGLFAANDHRSTIRELLRNRRTDPEGTINRIDRLIIDERSRMNSETLQVALGEKARIQMFILGDGVSGEVTAITAIAIDPKSKAAADIQSRIDSYRDQLEREG